MATHVMTTDGLARTEGRHLPALLTRLGQITRKLLASWAWYDNYRQTVRELSSLTNRELDDIGISRYEIPTIAMKSANTTTTLP